MYWLISLEENKYQSNLSKVMSETKGDYHDISHQDSHTTHWNKEELERVRLFSFYQLTL